MDPTTYAAHYDQQFRSALRLRQQTHQLNLAVLSHCLNLDRAEIGAAEEECLRREVRLLHGYIKQAEKFRTV